MGIVLWRNALRLMPPFQKKEELIDRLIDGALQSDTVPDLHMVAMVTGLVNFTMTPGEKPQIDKDTKQVVARLFTAINTQLKAKWTLYAKDLYETYAEPQ